MSESNAGHERAGVERMVLRPEDRETAGYVPTARVVKPAKPPKTPAATPPTAKKGTRHA